MGSALLALVLAGGCGDEAPRAPRDGGDADAPAQSAETPSGSASLPPSAGLAIPDTLETGPAAPSEVPDAAPAPDAAQVADAEEARRVVEEYYHAVTSGEYRQAYAMWEEGASGQTYDQFRRGFAGTDRVGVTAGKPGRVEGAAGSLYVRVPVVVQAVTTRGARERFEGTYTLRRSVVDGATEAQRRWRIYDAEIERVD